MVKETAVDGEIIHSVAQEFDMGAGMLKRLLQSPHLDEYENDSDEMKAVRKAYEKQREKSNI